MIRRPPRSTLFPIPTLFRPPPAPRPEPPARRARRPGPDGRRRRAAPARAPSTSFRPPRLVVGRGRTVTDNCSRSEEHTSELQSRQYLVCRLLLEKKKTTPILMRCAKAKSSTLEPITSPLEADFSSFKSAPLASTIAPARTRRLVHGQDLRTTPKW